MDIDGILQPASQQFILENQGKDPSQLMLSGKGIPGVSLADLVYQINARDLMRNKVPCWYRNPRLVYPGSLPLQQCSSELTAAYKSSSYSGQHLLDLTGGLGIDAYFFSKHFTKVTYIEQSEELCRLAEHNFRVLGAGNIKVVHGASEEKILEINEPVDLIYADPARRQGSRKVFKLDQCQPPVLNLLGEIWHLTDRVLLKLSPLLDISEAVSQLHGVKEVEVLSVKNECKELLMELRKGFAGAPRLRATNIQAAAGLQSMMLFPEQEIQANCEYSLPLSYLYEPNSSILKLGAFKFLCSQFALLKLHPNSHLYTSNELIENFPGRTFKIKWRTAYNKNKLSARLTQGTANITTRNFPYSVAAIRKATGIKDGGSHYLFATTLKDGKLAVICGEKL